MTSAPAPQPSVAQAAADRLRGRLMAVSLGLLLDRAPGAREVLPHLAALERGLLEHGLGALKLVPTHWLARICSQLSSLPLPEQDPPLHDLLRRLVAAQQRDSPEDDMRRDFDPERTMVIREISHSEFDAASEEEAARHATARS